MQISVLFVCFTEQELQATPTSTIGADTQLLYHMVDDYNRRYSGEPRSVCMEMEKKKFICIHITRVEYVSLMHGKGTVHPCTGTEALFRLYGP